MAARNRNSGPPEGEGPRELGRSSGFGSGGGCAHGAPAPGSHGALLLDSLPDAILQTDPLGRITWFNTQFQRRFGYSRKQLMGQLASLAAGPFAEEREGRDLLDLIKSGEGSIEFSAFSQEGVSMPALMTVCTPELPGQDLRLIVISDEEERNRLRAELVIKADAIQREKEILRATTESIEEGVLVLDDSERLVLINAAASQMLRISAESAQGRPLATVELPGVIRGKWLAFLAGVQPLSVAEVSLLSAGSVRQMLMQMARVVSVRHQPLGSVLVLTETTSEARAVESAESFAAFSHELRTPLASIRGFVSTLRDNHELAEEERHEFYQILYRDAARLGTMIEGLLEIAYLQNASCELAAAEIDLEKVVRRALMEVSGEEGVDPGKFSLLLSEDPITAIVDPARIQKVIAELLRNAIRHGWSERGARIQIGQQRGMVQIRVRDWGQGIAEQELDRVFEPFNRIRSVEVATTGEGAGLGLALCRQVVGRHDGTIRARLAEKVGLEVEIELPLDARL